MTLAQFISEHMEEILIEWEQFAATLSPMARQNSAGLRDHAKAILSAIVLDMQRPQSEVQQEVKSKGWAKRDEKRGETAAEQHGAARFAEGLDINQMVAEYRALRACVIRRWMAGTDNAESKLDDLTRFNEAVDQALTESIAMFSAHLNRSRELLMGVLGHDLRNPLGVILQSAQLLAMHPDVKGVPAKAVERILSGGRRAEELVTDLLDVARTRLGGALPLAPAPIDLRDVCHRAVDEARAHHPGRLVTLRVEGDVTGKWDGRRLVQLVSNLIENGLSHGGGNATVEITAYGEQDGVVLKVHNDGAIIPAAVINHVFDVMVQAGDAHGQHDRSSSLGLGLYICRAVAEAHGGSIDVTSSMEQGTDFTVVLPRHSEHRQSGQTVQRA